MITMPTKDPSEVLDYTIDYSLPLGDDTILTSTWTVSSGSVLVQNSSISGKTTIAWVAYGAIGIKNIIKNVITTSGGRTMVQSLQIPIAAL